MDEKQKRLDICNRILMTIYKIEEYFPDPTLRITAIKKQLREAHHLAVDYMKNYL